jgi:hypothetical protein
MAPLGLAYGQSTAVEVVPRAAPAPAPQAPLPDSVWPRLDERTALTLGAGKLQLGILAIRYGITDWLVIGTDPPAWAIRSVASVLVPNLHVKIVAVRRANLWVAGRAAAYYVFSNGGSQASTHAAVIPLSVFVSGRVVDKLWLHGEGTYVVAQVSGANDLGRKDLRGAAAANAGQLGLMAELRLNRTVALTATGRLQVYTSRVNLQGSGTVGDVQMNIDGRLTPRVEHPWEAIAGIALLWTHVRLMVGAGYGNYFVPGMDVPLPDKGFVPDALLTVVL